MKKLILLLFIALTSSLFISFTPSEVINNLNSEKNLVPTEIFKCKYRQCNATAKSTGNRCKHCVSNSGDYKCYQHK